ncbi:MAG: Cell-division protein, partial [candidate division WS6 bacterium GW2011_GWE1_34_7]
EIQIMHLVGSPDKFIRTPFLLEGTFYGLLGGLLSALLILTPWYILIFYSKGTDFSFWVEQFLIDIKLPFLSEINLLFLLIYLLVHIIVGSLFGFFSSLSAVRKYLRDE